MLQARPLGRFGAGYVLFMGTSGAFIAISIEVVEAGGLARAILRCRGGARNGLGSRRDFAPRTGH